MALQCRSGGMTVKEAGKRGGKTVKERYGPEFYKIIGRAGGKVGGKKGGAIVKERYGHAFYKAIGEKGGQRVKELIAAGHSVEREEEE